MADDIDVKEAKSGSGMKMFIIGIPLFLIQAVAIYFVTANILLNRFEIEALRQGTAVHSEKGNGGDVSADAENEDGVELGKNIYSLDDIIVNPAGTDGKKLVLASLGFDVASEDALKEMEAKEVIVKDIVISIMSSKHLSELKQLSFKDSLKKEIALSLEDSFKDVKINKVYFSKYIIQ